MTPFISFPLSPLLPQVKFSVFVAYAKACTYFGTLMVALSYVLTSACSVGQNVWLAHWSNQESEGNTSSNL